ncbi:DUF6770 family protein [Ferruginibacter profundus]
MKKIHLLFVVTAVLFSTTAFSQSKTLENVVDVELRNSVDIVNNKQIVGYAFFYKIDKMKKSALYRLEIVDENLKPIGNNEFEGSKDLVLKKAVYESNQILLSFYDSDKKDGYARFVKIFDLKGKETGTVPYDPEKVKKGMFGGAMADQMENSYEGTSNVEGKGFICVYQSKAKTGGVNLQMIDNNGKLKWEESLTADKGDRDDTYLVATTPNTILLYEINRGGIMSKDAVVSLIGLSTETGKQLFKKPMDIGDLTLEPMLIKAGTDGKLKIVSTMYNESDKFYTAKPIGFSIGELNDVTGDIKVLKNFNYQNDLSNVLDMKNESKSEEGYIQAHNLCLMPDGSMVLVGEFFRKTVSAIGVASRLLSSNGGTAAAQATIDDMFLLRIDNTMKAKSLEKIEKDKERSQIPTEGMSIGLMARWLVYTHSFGYMYTDEGLDGQKKTILARGSFGDEKYGTVAITIDPKKGFTQKRFDLIKEKKVTYFVTRGKPGTVLIMKYNSKDKTISLNLEKVN